MERRRQRRLGGRDTIILDSGAAIGWARRREGVTEFIEQALRREARTVVPAIVVAEVYRGAPNDPIIDRLLGRVLVPAVDLGLARDAGRLLARTRGSNTADALVVAEAVRLAPCALLTSDSDDIRRLAAGLAGIEVIDINAL